jgi:hypothetical protein
MSINGKRSFRNPFVIGGPVDTRCFFGRGREVIQVLDPVSHPSRGSVSIVGERRIGKTSLLHYVSAPDVIRRWNLDQTHSVFLYKDCGSIVPFSATRFWQSMLKDFSKELRGRQLDSTLSSSVVRLARADQITCNDIEDLLKDLDRANLLLVLLLDEFEYLIHTDFPEHEALTRDFLAGLRALINQRERVLSLIVATQQPLAELCGHIRFAGSPFFNNFVNVNLRPFSVREAEGFIDQMLADTGMEFLQKDKELMFDLGGTHPLLLQAAASCIFDERLSYDQVDAIAVQRRFTDLVQHHFEDLWKCSQPRKKEILMLLARDNELAPTRLVQWKRERDLLEKRGLITCQSDGSYRIFSTSFKQWLMDNLYDLDESPTATMSQPTVFPERVIKHLVFISYSHKDEQEKEALLTHVRVLERGAGLLNVWSDDRIAGGEQWEPAIEEAISSAKVAILLVSANFLTSDFINRKEVPELLRRRADEGLRVIPVIARPCAWQRIDWLKAMNVRPKNGDPIWKGQFCAEEELVKIAAEVATLVQR